MNFGAGRPEKKVRVAHVMFSLEPGGLENGVVNLANGLDRDRFETFIYCLTVDGAFSQRLREDVVVRCIGKKSGFSWAAVGLLIKMIRQDRPSLLHTHNLGPLIYGVGASWGSLRGVPILHGEHGVFQGEDLSRKSIFLRKCLYRFCRRVHTVSGSLREYIAGMGLPSSRLSAVLNGVDCERFSPPESKPSARRAVSLPEDSQVIGIVGRLIASKRHLMLLEAFETIAEKRPKAVLLIVGDAGGEREKVVNAIDVHPYRKRIHWVGHQADPAPFYESMDLLAMPSSKEGLSNALLEAMACGVPGLAHPACGASEVITDGKNGRLIRMENAADISDAAVALLEDSETLSQLGRSARDCAESEFSLSKMVENYSRLYEEVSRQTFARR